MNRATVTVLTTLLLLAVSALPAAALPTDRPVRLFPLGDSITRGISGARGGVGLDTLQGGYRGPLLVLLASAGLDVEFVGPYQTDRYGAHGGRNGATTDRLTRRVPIYAEDHLPDVWLLLIGTNDVAYGRETSANMEALLEALVQTGVPTLIAPIPPTVQAWQPAVVRYNAELEASVKRRQAGGQPLVWVPMVWTDEKVGDGVHPNAAGYNALAEAFATALLDRR